jgi:hypothetical protein
MPITAYTSPQERHFVGETRRLMLGDDAVWLVDAYAQVQLAEGTAIATTNKRFSVTSTASPGQLTLEFSDHQGVLDLTWTIVALDSRSATLQLAARNVGTTTLHLRQLDVLIGRLAQKSDPQRRHVLRNGFVLSPPHATSRTSEESSLTSHETLAIESPPLAAGWLTGRRNFGHVDIKDLNGYPIVSAWGECDGCQLPAGATRTSDLFFLSTHDHPLTEMERFASLAGQINQVKIWPPRIAWCTWYAGWQRKQMAAYRDGMERGIQQTIPQINRYFASRGATTMRICDDFLDYGDWSNVTKTIPRGFDRLARRIDQAGLTPGETTMFLASASQ